jgi:hypothetical protein
MNRWSSILAPAFVFFVGGAAACSSSPAETATGSTEQALSICNCPLETGDASCTCGPSVDAGACVSPPGGPCGGFTQSPCTCQPGTACAPNPIPDVPGRCVVCDPIVCPAGQTWDRALCECVGCVTAADCHGALPQLCRVCPNGGDGCAHWACVDHTCEIAYCQ